jgi:hypothetical protein
MQRLLLLACVSLFPSLARATEAEVRAAATPKAPSLRLINLPDERPNEARHTSLPRAFDAPAPIANDAQLRFDDMTRHAEHTVISALENAQHLGNHYRTWLWVTPLFGSVNGAAVRIDLK